MTQPTVTAGDIRQELVAASLPAPSRCVMCESPDVDRVHYPGNALLWFICQKCRHVWCALIPPSGCPPDLPGHEEEVASTAIIVAVILARTRVRVASKTEPSHTVSVRPA